MNALATLRQSAKDSRQAAKDRDREHNERTHAAARREFQIDLNNVLPPDIQEELHAQITTDSKGRIVLVLTYRDTPRQFNRGEAHGLTPAHIADWCDKVDAKITEAAQARVNARTEVLDNAPIATTTSRLNYLRGIVRNHKLTDDPDVGAALDAARDRIERQQAEAEAARQTEQQETIARLITEAAQAKFYQDLDEVECYTRFPEVEQALNQAWERIEQAGKEREANHRQAEQDAFYPHVIYCIRYAIAATDDGQAYLDTDYIYSTHAKPDPDGWFSRLNPANPPMMLTHVYCVERITVERVQDMPDDCPWHETPYGQIQIPPPGCQRLEPE